jgi:murein DD-endopeptidase MepM/ murein hydrolase activator NlpD
MKRRNSKNTKSPRPSSIEPLESRFLLANIHFVDAYFTDADGNQLTSVAVGNQPFLQVEFTTANLSAAAHYDVTTASGGRTFTNTLNWGAGLAGGSWVYRVGQYLIQPGQQVFSVTLDAGHDVTETDEGDNGTVHFFFGALYAPGFSKPLEGTINVDWSILNYNDVDADYPDDQSFSGPCEDFRGGPYCYDGHNGWDILPATWKQAYQGIDILAAAPGTVIVAEDGHDDHNTDPLGQPSNYVVIDHGGGWTTEYHHMARNSITVTPGQVITQAQVNAGFKLGLMGSSGNSGGVHLHWSVYYNGHLVEPMVDKADYLNYPLAYSGDAPMVMGTGVTNYDPGPEISEGPSDASTFLNIAPNQTVWSWAVLGGMDPTDQLGIVWRRPDNTIFSSQGPFTGYSRIRSVDSNIILPFLSQSGTWRVDWTINGVTKKSAFFDVVDPPGEAQAHIYRGSEYIVDGRTSPLDYGTLMYAQTTAPLMTFTVKNSGQVDLTTSGLNIPAGFFLAGGSSLAATIPAGGQDSFSVFADVFDLGHHEGFISFLTNDHSPGELVQSFKIEEDVLSASDAINSLVTSGDDNIYIVRESGFPNAQIFVNSDTPTWEVPISQIANLSINTLGGNDSLIVDFVNGSPLNATGMDYNGSSGTDQFTIWGSANNDAILISNHQGWVGLSHVDFTSAENIRAEGRGGDDTINIGSGSAQDLDLAGTNITVTGGNGSDDLILNDQDDLGNDIYILTSTTFDKTSFTQLNYSGMETLTLNANDLTNQINVESLLQTVDLTINARDGDDLIEITPTSDQLESVDGSVQVNGGAGSDLLTLHDQNHTANETYNINSAAITSTRTGLTPPSFGIGYATIEGATILSGSGSSIFNIQGSNAATPITIDAGDGVDSFNVTPISKNLDAINGQLRLTGGPGIDFLTIDDHNYGVPGFTINSFTTTSFTTSHAAAILYPGVEHITYHNGDDGGLTTIKSLPASLLTLDLLGHDGADSFLVGEAATGLAPLGTVSISIDGGAANDSIAIHDDSNANNDTYTLTSTTFDKTGFGTLGYSNAENLQLYAGAGNNLINVQSTANPTSIYANAGSDVINLATGNLNAIGWPITVSGDAGVDSIILNDQSNFVGATTFITPTTVVRSLFGSLTYSTAERLILNSPDVADTTNVNGTAPNMTVTVNPNGGTDTVNVNETDPTSPVTITPSTGDDTVNVNTDATGSAAALFPDTVILAILSIGSGGRADLAAGGADKVLRTVGLSITGTGVLNIADHAAVVQATAATRLTRLAAVQNLIKSAHDSSPSAWTGPGLTSSAAAANPASRAVGYMLNGTGGTTYATFDGLPVDLNSILVRYTVLGDLNLDKTVSISDFIDLSSNFNASGGWREGDLNFDGQITISDFIDLSANFNTSLPTPPQAPAYAPAAQELAIIEPLSLQTLQADTSNQVLKTKPHRVIPKTPARQRPHHRMKMLQRFR